MLFPVRKTSYETLKHSNMFALKAQARMSLTRWPLHSQNRWDVQLLVAAMGLLVTLSKVTRCRHRILKVRLTIPNEAGHFFPIEAKCERTGRLSSDCSQHDLTSVLLLDGRRGPLEPVVQSVMMS